jgi:hypothetical protein
MPPTAAVRLRTAGVPPRCGKVKRPASSTVNLPVSRPLSCRWASTPCSARRPRGVQTRSFDAPRSLAAVSRYEGLQYPAAAGWHRRGLMFASRPRSPPTAPTSHRPEHWLEAATHTVVTWGPLGPTRLTGREPTHASRARTPLLGAQRARRVPLPERRAVQQLPGEGPCPTSAALTTEPQPVHRLRIASLLSRSAGSASVCCATAAPRPLPPGASAPETLRLSRGLPCSSAACRGRALTPTSTNGTSSLRRRR